MWYNTISSSFRCSLGDVTSDDKCYEKAQEVSGNKSARAQVNQNVLLPTLVIAVVFSIFFLSLSSKIFWDPNSFYSAPLPVVHTTGGSTRSQKIYGWLICMLPFT